VMVGTFTIPMMKKMGFSAVFAGAVECAASIGATIMPPVMGALVFVLAELTGTPLAKVMLAFLIPAILYFLGILLQVHFEAVKMGMGTSKDTAVQVRDLIKRKGHLLIPIVVICVLLGIGWEPVQACSLAILITLIAPWLRKETRLSWKQVYLALYQSARNALIVAISLALAGLVLVCLFDTGVAAELTYQVSILTAGNLLLALIIAGVFSILLGMVGPALAAYLIVALVIAPLIVKQGSPILVAHVFSLYLANIAGVTPPIAVAAFVAASLAGASYIRIGFTAMRLAIAALAVPYIAVYRPALLIVYGTPLEILLAVAVSLATVFCISVAAEGYLASRMGIPSRILLFAAGLVLIPPNVSLNIAAVVVAILVVLWNVRGVLIGRIRGQSSAAKTG
jgi:TRAP transporter 4TM/12TM fusion protein